MIRQAAPLIVTRIIPTPVDETEKGIKTLNIASHVVDVSPAAVPLMLRKFRHGFMVPGSGRRLFTTNS